MEKDPTAALARGRALLSTARKVLLATASWTALLIAAGWSAVRLGWITDDDPVSTGLVVGWLAGACVGFAGFVVLSRRGRRLITEHIRAVAALPAKKVPATLRIGPQHPDRVVAAVVAAVVVALVVLPFDPGSFLEWVPPEASGAFGLVLLALRGPYAMPLPAADLTATGIRLPLLGIEIPWTSVSEVHVADGFHLAVTLGGPVHPTRTRPARWTKRALATYRPYTVVRVLTNRPELAYRVATRHLTRTPGTA